MAAPQTIDLGLDRLEPGYGPRTAVPAGRLGRVRRWIPAVVMLLVAVVLAGSAAPPVESLAVAGALSLPSGGDFRLFADTTYTIGPATGGGSNIIAYDGTQPRWFLSVHATSDFIVLAEAGDTTLVTFGSSTTVRAVDRATGHIRWQRAGVRVAATQGSRVLLVQAGVGTTVYLWCVVDTGAVLWQRSVPSEWATSNITASADPAGDGFSGTTEAIFAVSPTGDVRALYLDDLGTEVSGQVTIEPPEGARPLFVIAVPGTLVMIQATEKEAIVSGYATPSFTTLWRQELGTDDGTIDPNATMAPCGVVICEYEGADATGIDPSTGRPLWTARSAIVTPFGGWLLLTPIGPPGSHNSVRVIDPRTGKVLLRLAQWILGSVDQDDALFVTPPLTAQVTEVADLRLARRPGDPPSLRLLGAVDEATSDCRSAGVYVACVTTDGRLKLWRRRAG